MSALFVRTRRSNFIDILGRYWDSFISTWNVLLHGNPAVSLYGGIKLAASGELGIGVGEEDRGSGEREVLEGFVGRIEGLVDLVVSRFGDADDDTGAEMGENEHRGHTSFLQHQSWLGTGAEPSSEDGAIFLGTGALSRKSLRDVAHWIEDLYRWGPYAYGVIDNPTSTRGVPRSKKHRKAPVASPDPSPSPSSPHISGSSNQPHNPLLIQGNQMQHSAVHGEAQPHKNAEIRESANPELQERGSSQSSTPSTQTSRLISYFKLGYGTHWTLGSASMATTPDLVTSKYEEDRSIPPRVTDTVGIAAEPQKAGVQSVGTPGKQADLFDDSKAHWLIGLLGDLEQEDDIDDVADATEEGGEPGQKKENRIMLRTVTMELEREIDARTEVDISIDFGKDDGGVEFAKAGTSERTNASTGSYEAQDRNKTKKLRVAVYVNKPFIFALFFELRTESLALSSLYRSLHHQLAPLRLPLLNSTQQLLMRPEVSTTVPHDPGTPIYDLLWDSKSLTISSTIPNIPDGSHRGSKTQSWSRMEALNTHIQIINTFLTARTEISELERTSKTSRGWWVVWTRIPVVDEQQPDTRLVDEREQEKIDGDKRAKAESKPNSEGTNQPLIGSMAGQSNVSGPAHPYLETELDPRDHGVNYKEIFLIRRAGDNAAESRLSSGSYTSNKVGWGSTPAKLAQGIGVDTKRYIEGLLSLYP